MPQPVLLVDTLGKAFDTEDGILPVIEDVSFSVAPGEFVAIVGPSGSGKSTFFNILAGLLAPTSGTIFLDGVPLTGPSRSIGYMQQKDLLLPWLRIEDNVTLALRLLGRPKPQWDQARRQLDRFGLGQFARAYPSQLSGGMRQRAALLRTLATDPTLLLLDEPFSALDFQTRLVLEGELLDIAASRGMTTLLVTHDIGEAISLADRVLVFSPRPTRVIRELHIDFEAPRDVVAVRADPRYSAYFQEIWGLLSHSLVP